MRALSSHLARLNAVQNKNVHNTHALEYDTRTHLRIDLGVQVEVEGKPLLVLRRREAERGWLDLYPFGHNVQSRRRVELVAHLGVNVHPVPALRPLEGRRNTVRILLRFRWVVARCPP